MGNEATCVATLDGESAVAKVLLETAEIIVRAPFRLRVPFAGLTSVSADGPMLRLRWPSHELVLELGAAAASWSAKIQNPKTVVQKLGVREGHRISIVGQFEEPFLADLLRCGADVSRRLRNENDMVFFALAAASDLERLGHLRETLLMNGAVWVIRLKGRGAIPEAEVRAAGRTAGLVEIKVVSFSPTHTAEKFVIRHRPRGVVKTGVGINPDPSLLLSVIHRL